MLWLGTLLTNLYLGNAQGATKVRAESMGDDLDNLIAMMDEGEGAAKMRAVTIITRISHSMNLCCTLLFIHHRNQVVQIIT